MKTLVNSGVESFDGGTIKLSNASMFSGFSKKAWASNLFIFIIFSRSQDIK
jgi:hypothetical protein